MEADNFMIHEVNQEYRNFTENNLKNDKKYINNEIKLCLSENPLNKSTNEDYERLQNIYLKVIIIIK